MDEPTGPMYAAIAAGTVLSDIIIALTHPWAGAWLIPIPVAGAATVAVALVTRR